eukprot:m.204794 g.204794  ORF g.204794 m.204794 type:complete len:667 (+) comp22656_c0_seq1:178-2178(+)
MGQKNRVAPEVEHASTRPVQPQRRQTSPNASQRKSWVRGSAAVASLGGQGRGLPAMASPQPVASIRQPAGYRPGLGATDGSGPIVVSPVPVRTEMTPQERARRAERSRSIHEARAHTAFMGSGPPTPLPGYHITVARKKSPLPPQLAPPPPQPVFQTPPPRRGPTTNNNVDVDNNPNTPETARTLDYDNDEDDDDSDVMEAHVENVQRSAPPPRQDHPDVNRGGAVPRAVQTFALSSDEEDTSSSEEEDNTATDARGFDIKHNHRSTASDSEAAANQSAKDGKNNTVAKARVQPNAVDETVVVTLTRHQEADAFGFDVQANEKDGTLSVTRLSDVLVADGRLHEGDVLQTVNGNSVSTSSPSECDAMIASSGTTVMLTLQRTHTVASVVGRPMAAEDSDASSDEEATLRPPPVYASAARFDKTTLGDEEAGVKRAHKGGKFSSDGHGAAVKSLYATGSKAESRMMTLSCLLGVVVIVCCIFMVMACSSDDRLLESFHFGKLSDVVSNSSQVGEAMFGLWYVRLRYGNDGRYDAVKYDTTTCSDATPLLDEAQCISCKDAGAWVGRTLAVLLVLNVIRIDIVSPRRRLKGNVLYRRVLGILLSTACFCGDVMLLYAFHHDCFMQWRDDEEVTSTYGPGSVLAGVVVILDAIILVVNCAIPHAQVSVK